jgi:SPP1 gp7 family putative phage head morphogenesis protein
MAYWQDRMQASQRTIASRRQRDIDKRIRKYYKDLSKQVIADYEALYNEILLKKAAGETISPATLYQMDKYWSMNAQLRKHLTKTGSLLQAIMSKGFELLYKNSYSAISLKGLEAFSTIDDAAIQQVLNAVWAADGKSWSNRVWDNLTLLQETLDEELIHCVVAGKKTTNLKHLLQDRFNVSYHRANTLVRTEIAHIQTEAARQRYMDYGIQQVEIWADADERRCPECGKLHQKKYPVGAHPPIPAHPNCRCCIVPVVDVDDV